MPDAEDQWYFAKERLQETPSRRHGYDYEKELSSRQQAANFIQDMGQKLCVSQLCINTAIVYMHRFYVFHSLGHFHRNAIATAALFLAAKVEEQPRKVEHVLKVAHLCLHRDNPTSLDPKSEQYQEQSNDLVLNESILLQTLGFDVAIDHPHTHVVRCCHLVKASKDLAQTSYFMASNSLHLTTMCLQYKPTVVACFCIHLACKWSNWEIPRSSEGKDWFWYVNQSVTLDLLEQLTSEFLFIFDKCPTKLKKKMMSMNQNNPPVSMPPPAQSGSHQASYHFDEPRKLTGAEANRPPEAFLQAQAQQKAAEKSLANPVKNVMGQPTQPVRHMDYKDKKDRERAEREKMHREGYSSSGQQQQQGGHMPNRPVEKVLPHQRPSVSAPDIRKSYPQQRPHSGHQASLPQKEQQRPAHLKEPVKRKFDEVDTGPEAKKYPHKLPPHYPGSVPPKVLAAPEDHTASGIRDIITQSFSQPAEKSQERSYPNFPYQQRPATDKYGRLQQAPAIPPNKEKRPEDLLQKQKPEIDDPHGKGYPSSMKPIDHKARDPKYKGHAPSKHPGPSSHSSSVPPNLVHQHRKPHEKVADKSRKYTENDRGLPISMDNLLAAGIPEQKRPPYNPEPLRKDGSEGKHISKSKQSYKTESLLDELFNITETDNSDLSSIFDSIEPPVKMARKEEPTKPLGFFMPESNPEISKPSSIFSPDNNVPPKNIVSSFDKELKAEPLLTPPPMKKVSSSLFSPPPVPKTSSHRSSTSSDRELVIPSTKIKDEKMMEDIISFPLFTDPIHEQKPFKEKDVKIETFSLTAQNHSGFSDPVTAHTVQDRNKSSQNYNVEIKPGVLTQACTVNLVGMERMVDTSIALEKAAVMKPPSTARQITDQSPMKLIQQPSAVIIKEEKILEERPAIPQLIPTPSGDSEISRKEKKKKEKDSHRHKEKKKKEKDSESKKEKKKHKDKDKERKKDSHKDKDKHREKEKHDPSTGAADPHLKITIPKEKIHLNSGDNPGSGLKIKIAKDRLKPEDIEGHKPSVSTEGTLKIKIKKETITNYKDETKSSSKKKESSSSHSSSHKSSKSSDKKSSRSSESTGHTSRSSKAPSSQ